MKTIIIQQYKIKDLIILKLKIKDLTIQLIIKSKEKEINISNNNNNNLMKKNFFQKMILLIINLLMNLHNFINSLN